MFNVVAFFSKDQQLYKQEEESRLFKAQWNSSRINLKRQIVAYHCLPNNYVICKCLHLHNYNKIKDVKDRETSIITKRLVRLLFF